MAAEHDLRARPLSLPLGWPVYALLGGLPLWWLLGLGSLIWPMFAVPMALWLSRQRQIHVPRGFGLWMLFIAWVVASGAQLDAPERLISFGYRLALYISAGILLLYVFNMDRQWLPRDRVVQLVAMMWVCTVAGGFAALLWPTMSATSLAERLLPASLSSHPFVYDLVHLRFAQYSVILDYPVPRPTAPYAYTNDWGSNFGILTPIYLLWLVRRPWGGVRVAGTFLLLAAALPAVKSLNRGMWLSLGATLLYASLRLALRGRGRQLVVISFVLLGVVGAYLVSPLPQIVSDRIATPHSDEGRMAIYEGAAEGALQSPILGYGTTRPQDEAEDAGGRQIGTHGQLWMVMFSHGFPGLLLFLMWLLVLFWRTGPANLSASFYVHLAFFAALVQTPYYGLIPAQLHVLMLLAGVVLRPDTRIDQPTRTVVTA